MNAFRRVIEASNSHRLRQSRPKLNKCEFWRKAAAALPTACRPLSPTRCPKSQRRLQRKFNEYMRDGYVCFISKKYPECQHAAKSGRRHQGKRLGATDSPPQQPRQRGGRRPLQRCPPASRDGKEINCLHRRRMAPTNTTL